MRTQTIQITMLAAVAAALASGTVRASFQGTPAAAGENTMTRTLEFGGQPRTYLVHLPPGIRRRHPVAMVLVLHGATQSPESAERMSGMSRKADAEGFIAVYPRGTGRLPTWNAGGCCGAAMENRVDDTGFLREMIEALEREYPVDARRVYATGISNGAMMSYRLGCELADKVAGIAPVEGAMDVECQPSAPVSAIIFHGTADRLVPYDGGTTPFQMGSKRTDLSVAGAVNFWVKQDTCSPVPRKKTNAEARVDVYSRCAAGTAVELYTIEGGRHMWPGVPPSGNHVPATDLIWSFFQAHPKR